MEKKSKSNLAKMEQEELSKLSNEIIVIKLADKGGAVKIFSTSHYQTIFIYWMKINKKTRFLHRQQNTE